MIRFILSLAFLAIPISVYASEFTSIDSYRNLLSKSPKEVGKIFPSIKESFIYDAEGNKIHIFEVNTEQGYIKLFTKNGLVNSILFTSPSFKTERNIRIGSTFQKVVSAYPKSKYYGGVPGVELITVHALDGTMILSFDTREMPMEKIMLGNYDKNDTDLQSLSVYRIYIRNKPEKHM